MSKMKITYRCPNCHDKFTVAPGDEPTACPHPNCGYEYVPRDPNVVYMPAFLSPKTKATDQVARDVMDSSERRAEMAAEQAGCSVEDMAGLKVTDLKEKSEYAVPEVVNSVTQFMDQTGVGGFQGAGAAYAGAVQSGPHPNMGARMRTQIHAAHSALSGGHAVSDRPALEVSNPGYRRRG